jgi:pimeloyl-ACP methyl ester carboxylesterase
LIIHGQADALVPVSNSVRLAAMLPGAELVVVPSCGHVPQEEQPQRFADAVVHFFREHWQRRTKANT